MSSPNFATQSIWSLLNSGGFSMIPLLICSLMIWGVIFERLWSYWRIGQGMRAFHLEAFNAILLKDRQLLSSLCSRYPHLPTARLLHLALERLNAKDPRIRSRWLEALERQRQLINQDLRSNLWILGTIGSAAPFIGLFGTVVGILRSFQEMARTGSGGFAVVAAGISESLIATAAGIVVAVISVMAYNAFQVRWSRITLMLKMHIEELAEILGAGETGDGS